MAIVLSSSSKSKDGMKEMELLLALRVKKDTKLASTTSKLTLKANPYPQIDT